MAVARRWIRTTTTPQIATGENSSDAKYLETSARGLPTRASSMTPRRRSGYICVTNDRLPQDFCRHREARMKKPDTRRGEELLTDLITPLLAAPDLEGGQESIGIDPEGSKEQLQRLDNWLARSKEHERI